MKTTLYIVLLALISSKFSEDQLLTSLAFTFVALALHASLSNED